MRIIAGDERGIGPSSARASLSLLSGLYLLGYEARRAAYGARLLRSCAVEARVVSVGNITAGGTGKTPATIYFARRFFEDGRKVVVLSRGYGRSTPMDEPAAVSDGHTFLLSPRESGDEPYLIARKLPSVPVVVCGDRVRGANFAIEKFGAETIVLDDGFQHIALSRNEDIVVIDCTAPFGFGHLLPRGLLREPLSALRRATAFLLTRADECEHRDTVERLMAINPTAEILLSRHRPVRLSRLGSGDNFPCDFIAGKRVLALSSIGNPMSFETTLGRLSAEVATSLRFKDHHWYSLADLEKVQEAAQQSRAEHIVSTEKDGVRLGLVADAPKDILLLEVELEMIGRHH